MDDPNAKIYIAASAVGVVTLAVILNATRSSAIK
jgi:hypothetical protein